jgi:hypothetical protein
VEKPVGGSADEEADSIDEGDLLLHLPKPT